MNFYNENDPKTAAWLRELIKAGLIADGIVDERSIIDLRAADLDGFRQCHFFAGIGGWSYALRLAGVADEEEIWTGSCPCQPLSSAGLRKGHADERHLWPAFYRLIAERHPAIVFGEQVASKDGREWLAGIRADLEGAGYAVGAADLCAAGVQAPHPRQRLYWLAYAFGGQRKERKTRKALCGAVSQSVGCGSTRGLVLPNGAGRDARQQASATDGYRRAAESAGDAGGMGDAIGKGLEGQRGFEPESAATGRQGEERHNSKASRFSFWDSFDVCYFTGPDASKVRRIEAGTFPLANGIPNRVGLLRGYGNAIVPQVAALFIEAAREAIQS